MVRKAVDFLDGDDVEVANDLCNAGDVAEVPDWGVPGAAAPFRVDLVERPHVPGRDEQVVRGRGRDHLVQHSLE
jgi:hypothetical protein